MYVDCYLSRTGEFYYGLSHFHIAQRILDDVYGLNGDSIQNPDLTEEQFWILKNPERFLEEQGWMKYINRCGTGWWIHPLKTPTQAQINAIFKETGEDITKLGDLF